MKINCRSSCHLCPPPELLAIVERVREAEKSTLLPTGDDLRGTAIAIARLRRIYRLAITDLVDGRLLDAVTSARLTIYDCLMIADESFKAKDFTSAWLWSRYAWTATTHPEMKAYVSRLMAAVSKEHDDTWNGETDHFPARLSEGQSQVPHDITYDRLCRGEHFMSEEEGTGLRCRVSAMGQPHLVLQPVKYEQLHFDPEMYLFYDVLSDSEIQAIKDSALSKLFRSGTLAPEVYSDIRVSQTAWLTNASHPLLPGICRRISAITGLNVFEGPDGSRAGEDLQVLSYGVGGHYIYHVDVLFKNLPEDQWHETTAGAHVIQDGDRMATWMFYLSDVERGGRTAFPKAGISVPPVKGAAVMWFNLKKNGDVNPRAEHGGCPVLLGHKWVANKWIREHANFLKRPCSIQPFE
ncbi:hypothetical protein C7M84_023863 [Penaeus vannamei]|uniref:Uncharacterized protein n=2 Tax=Penaeus vannamei TaxID=6689 RepID=A0A423U2U8_PENVA|nr:prolyl 4-hydroxylase subunit alpha-1-like [Penaeus vannamei]ROT82962.1 hypothetical protein C7M84_023863 [Penaeus vannamei]